MRNTLLVLLIAASVAGCAVDPPPKPQKFLQKPAASEIERARDRLDCSKQAELKTPLYHPGMGPNGEGGWWERTDQAVFNDCLVVRGWSWQ